MGVVLLYLQILWKEVNPITNGDVFSLLGFSHTVRVGHVFVFD